MRDTIVCFRHIMDKRNSCISQTVQKLLLWKNKCSAAQKLTKIAIGMVMHDFNGFNTMTFHRIADIPYF